MKYISLFLMLILWSGCTAEFLEKVDPNQVSKDSFWKDADDAIAGVNGVFDALQGENLYGKTFINLESLSDNAYNDFFFQNLEVISEGNHTPADFGLIPSFWSANFTVINRANEVLANVAEMDIDQVVKDRVMGEAYFLRALAYLNLTMMYGDVPLILEPVSFEDPFYPNHPRNSTKDQMVADLDLAERMLPETNPGRVTNHAAIALRARWLLYYGEFSAAAASLQPLLNAYTLHPDFAELFTQNGETSDEILFSVNFVSGNLGEGERFSGGRAEAPQRESVPILDLVSLYDTADTRLAATILQAGEDWLGQPWDATTGSLSGFARKKYTRQTGAQNEERDGPVNFIVIRFADVLLMYAEAQNEASGPDASVYQAVNQVRLRAGLPDAPAGLSQAEMRELIRVERRLELAMEGFRYFDLLRWNELESVVNTLDWNANVPGHNRVFVNNLLPIPQSEIDNNPDISQNPGW